MEYITLILATILGGGAVLLFRKKSISDIKTAVLGKEQELKRKQEATEAEVIELENRLNNLKNKIKGKAPKEIEDYWNED